MESIPTVSMTTDAEVRPIREESQVILRLPDAEAAIVRDILRSNPSQLRERMKVQLDPQTRQGKIYLDNFALQANLVDLPCIIESHKTVEESADPEEETHIYKTADISQMLLCSKEGNKCTGDEQNKDDFVFPHGITPPLENVRNVRFRKTIMKKRSSDQSELEREAQQITSDGTDDDEEGQMHGSTSTHEEPGSSSSNKAIRAAIASIFGEDLSDFESDHENMEHEEEEYDEHWMDEEEGMDEEDEGNESLMTTAVGVDVGSEQKEAESLSNLDSLLVSQSKLSKVSVSDYKAMTKAELFDQLVVLKEELNDINNRSQIQQAELSIIDNVGLKQRLSDVLDKLVNDQMDKQNEIKLVEELLAAA